MGEFHKQLTSVGEQRRLLNKLNSVHFTGAFSSGLVLSIYCWSKDEVVFKTDMITA